MPLCLLSLMYLWVSTYVFCTRCCTRTMHKLLSCSCDQRHESMILYQMMTPIQPPPLR